MDFQFWSQSIDVGSLRAQGNGFASVVSMTQNPLGRMLFPCQSNRCCPDCHSTPLQAPWVVRDFSAYWDKCFRTLGKLLKLQSSSEAALMSICVLATRTSQLGTAFLSPVISCNTARRTWGSWGLPSSPKPLQAVAPLNMQEDVCRAHRVCAESADQKTSWWLEFCA